MVYEKAREHCNDLYIYCKLISFIRMCVCNIVTKNALRWTFRAKIYILEIVHAKGNRFSSKRGQNIYKCDTYNKTQISYLMVSSECGFITICVHLLHEIIVVLCAYTITELNIISSDIIYCSNCVKQNYIFIQRLFEKR